MSSFPPAGAHTTVLLEEAVEGLAIKSNGIYVDGTFGRGGHSRAILSGLGPDGRLVALDKDPQAVAAASVIEDSRFTVRQASFSALSRVLDELGVDQVDGVLLDLGVSSPQLDECARGMSFRFDAPLDMRMDTSCGQTVAQWLAEASVGEITEVIKNYGEERFAYAVAKAIDAARQRQPVATTLELAALVEKAVRTREPGLHPATRTFQALRIFINRELEELSLVLPQCLACLKPGGRLVIISFHSLEDRMVKRFMREQAQPDNLPSDWPVRADELPPPLMTIIGKPIRASKAEVLANPRSRSAIMRVAERCEQRQRLYA